MKTHVLPLVVLLYVVCLVVPIVGQMRSATARLVSQHNPPRLEFAAFSPDERLLATSGQTDITQIWEVATGRLIREFPAEPNRWHINGDSFVALAVSHDNRTVAIYYQGIVRLYDISNGRLLNSYAAGTQAAVELQCMSFSKDKAILFLESVYLSPDKKWISAKSPLNLATKRIGRARLTEAKHWGCFDEEEAQRSLRNLGGEFAKMDMDRGFNKIIAVAPDGDLIALGQTDEADSADIVRIVSRSRLKELQQVRGYSHTDLASEIAWYAAIETGGAGFHSLLQRIRNDWPIAWENVVVNDRYAPWRRDDIVFSSNNRYAVVTIEDGNDNRNFAVVDIFSGRVLYRIERPHIIRVSAVSGDGRVAILEYFNEERMSEVDVNGSTLTYNNEANAQLIDLQKNIILKTFGRDDGIFETVTFSADGNLLAALVSKEGDTGGRDYHLMIWDVVANCVKKMIHTAQDEVSGVAHSLAFSADGKQIAIPSSGTEVDNNEEVWLHDIQTGLPGRIKLKGHVNDVWEVVFSPDGRYLATLGRDDTARVWDAQNGRERFRIEAPGSGIRFSMDGMFVYTNTVIFRTADGGEVGRFFTLADAINVFVAPDGRFDVTEFGNLTGLHWVMSDAVAVTVPFEIFMRVYYEPELLSRSLKCNRGPAGKCSAEFKPLPPIGSINRVQAKARVRAGL